MDLITLNAWGGTLSADFISFVRSHAADTDVFCFQEVDHQGTGKFLFHSGEDPELYGKILAALPEHAGFFHPSFDDFFGLASFVRKSVDCLGVEDEFVHLQKGFLPEEPGERARNVQLISLVVNGKSVSILNFHGLWNGKGKTDSSDRLEQSRRLAEVVKRLPGDVILCGDFNLEPGTESLAILEACGLRNLIKEFGVTSTRTSHYPKPGRFADYILVSKGIEVKSFEVLPDEVSDHAALRLEFT